MIHKIGQIMLYVNDQDEAKKFWTEKVGFTVISEEDNGHGMRWIEIAPTAQAETSIVLHNKELIAQMQPELNLQTPSLLLFTENLDALYEDLKSKQVTVGELVTMPTGRVFNFADDEDNYFAVLEKK
ncbi:VOC family protein [Sporosarcina sp. Marseille-Q4943]|uniref:VOC family protein n=1 Tax=Sporosarcina sp. Marseille-Q4943 TaxID=2942204 RepID=UPI00208DCD2A|nr:VOC family protein [Sporosarcina sp. Marseille-Q4943]